MGLDQNLFEKRKEPMIEINDWDDKEYEVYAGEPICSWRKANQINSWFGRNLESARRTNGEILNLTEYNVTRAELEQLIADCLLVVEEKRDAVADEIMPTQGGFFFGSTDYDEWYYKELEDTAEDIQRILNNCDDEEFIYEIWY